VERPSVSAESLLAYQAVSAQLAQESGATAGKMMGMPTLYLAGKAFAGLYGDAMVFKLAGTDHADALGLAEAALFDPSGAGRPMMAWVQVPLAHAAKWPRFAGAAAGSVAEAG
jgi:hypothetical protein